MEANANSPLPTISERRIRDAATARSLWMKLRTASVQRRDKWVQVQNQLDGAPPFANRELLELGQSWRCNVNFRDAASTLEQVLISYWRLLHDTTNLAAVAYLTPDDPNAEKWEQIFQTNFNRFVDDWGPDYVRNYLLFSQNHVSFGVGVAFWNDKFTPRWEAVRIGDVEVPTRSKASIEKLTLVGVRQEMEIDFLWALIRDEKSKSAAKQRGWNTDAIEAVLVREFVKQEGNVSTPVTGQDVLELQRLMRDNALGVTTGHDPIKLVHLLVKDYDGKISRMIFAEMQEHQNDFLFDDFNSDSRPDSMNEVLGAVFFDAGNGDWWGTKGFGVKNFQLATVQNRLKSRAVDRTLLDGLNFRDLSEGGRETVPITTIGPFNFLPKDVEQIPSYPTGRTILETIELIDSQVSYNNARYRDQGKQIAQTDTATQANILSTLQSQVDVANATLYLRQIARNLFAEQFRRLRMRGNPDLDAKKFKKRCTDEMGMPEDVFHNSEIALRTGADPGAMNLAMQGDLALQGMTLPSGNKRWFEEKWVTAKFGAQAVSKALNPVDATSEIRSVRLALMENSDMGEGNPLPVDPQDNHAAHAPAHLQPVEVIIHNYDATGRVDPNALIALQNVIPHLAAHFEALKQDKMQEALYKELWPRFTAAQSGAEGIFRAVERMHNEAQQVGAAPGGFSPAATLGAATPQ
ncbi:MAG: hypothetical protein ACO3EH_00515 [Ilumatobacteraceae bacterium]